MSRFRGQLPGYPPDSRQREAALQNRASQLHGDDLPCFFRHVAGPPVHDSHTASALLDRAFVGEESQGMILAVDGQDEKPLFVSAEGLPVGSKVR